MNNLLKAVLIAITCHLSALFAADMPIEDFPIENYSQQVTDYLPPNAKDYSNSLLTKEYQSLQFKQFYNHYYSTKAQSLSPWSKTMVNTILPEVKKVQLELLDDFSNKNGQPTHFGENYKIHDDKWLAKITKNMALDHLNSLSFNTTHRAIVTNNTLVRALPESEPDFFHFSLPGQGFPFDNLQMSALWVGTPIYIISQSVDKAWSLVLTPDGYYGWLKSNDIAYVSKNFIAKWQQAARKSLAAITQTEASIVNSNNQFQFSGHIGAVFPLKNTHANKLSILIPIKDSNNNAVIKVGIINKNAAHRMPLAASKTNIAMLLKQLQNRPYGWGGAFFYNDCSQELKNLFTPFGIWLPRNSAQQAKLSSTLDLSHYNLEQRLSLLKQQGHPLMTIIYINGHVMLYLGNIKTKDGTTQPITYQNVWGLAPITKDKRYIIGQSLFLPLLKDYPEKPDVISQADKPYFKLIFLDKLNT